MKKFFITLMCIIMVVCFMPTVAMAEGEPENTNYGTVSKITDIATVKGANTENPVVECSSATLAWAPADAKIGRMNDGWWVGIKITAPDGMTKSEQFGSVKYQTGVGNGWSIEKSFWDAQDSDKNATDTARYLTMWGQLNQEYLNNAKARGKYLEYKWRFNWNGDDTFEQTVILRINPNNIILSKGGDTVYPTTSNMGTADVITNPGLDISSPTGDIAKITNTNNVTLSWSPSDPSAGRSVDGWWVGIKVTAPSNMTKEDDFKSVTKEDDFKSVTYKTYTSAGWSVAKSFWDAQDSDKNATDTDRFLTMWGLVNEDYLKLFKDANASMIYKWQFDWDKDNVYEQLVVLEIDPNKVTLQHIYDGATWMYDADNHWQLCTTCCSEGKKIEGNKSHHTYGDWTVEKAASYTEKGSKKHTCSVCGYEETVEIPMLTLPYIPTTPTTPTDNVTNSGSTAADNASTSADLSGSTSTSNGTTTATVDKTTADKIVDKAVENKSTEVVIDATANTTTAANSTTIAQVTIPTETLGAIAEKTEADVTIKTDVAEVKMDNAAAAAVSEQAEGDTVQIIAEKVAEDAEKVEFELKVVCSEGKVISDFNGGNIAVTVALPKAMAEKKVVCVYIDDNGHMSKVEGQKNADGTYTFFTGHFSTYAIMAEEEADAAIAAQTEAIKNIKIKLTSKQVKTKSGKKGIKITWTAAAGDKTLDGVEVFRSKEKNKGYGTKAFFTSTKGGNKGSYINTKSLKKGTRYYYKVRGYVLVNGEKVYTDYSTKAWRTVK